MPVEGYGGGCTEHYAILSGREGSDVGLPHGRGRHRALREVTKTEPRASRDKKESRETKGTQG